MKQWFSDVKDALDSYWDWRNLFRVLTFRAPLCVDCRDGGRKTMAFEHVGYAFRCNDCSNRWASGN